MITNVDGDDQIARLLKLAGRRPAPDARRMSRVRAAARGEWSRAVRARGRRRWTRRLSAVVVAGVLGFITWWSMDDAAPRLNRPAIVTIQRAIGRVRVTDASGRTSDLGSSGPNGRLRAGDRVEAAEGSRAGFELLNGMSVRLNSGTVVVFASSDRLQLKAGTVYVESPTDRTATIRVDTPFGTVSHLGTQFELRVNATGLNVRVREGRIVLEARSGRWTSRAGEALLFKPDAPAERTRIPVSGPDWAWLSSLARPFTLEGATAASFLQWVSREQGWRCEYADAATKRLAERAVLHGSIEGLTPEEAMAAVLPATDLASTRTGDRLIVHSHASR